MLSIQLRGVRSLLGSGRAGCSSTVAPASRKASAAMRARRAEPAALAPLGDMVGRAGIRMADPAGSGGEGEHKVVYNTEFGYSRKDIFLIGTALIALGYVMYYGLQALGLEPGIAGNWVQFVVFVGICVGYISTYIYRVATKQMTYVQQLKDYEEAVMRKRLEEMTEAELSQLMQDVEEEKRRGGKPQQPTN